MSVETKWRSNPIALGVAVVVAAAAAILILPPVVRFFAFLFNGDVWRAMIGVALLALIAGVLIAGFLGRSDTRRGGQMRKVGLFLILLSPACVLVALVASGWLIDGIDWIDDAVPAIRKFLAGE